MKKCFLQFSFYLFIIFLPLSTSAQNKLNDMGFSGQFFISYDQYFDDREIDNEINLNRGYFTFKRDLTENINVRFTQDILLDQEGDGRGNLELRLKYAFVNVTLGDFAFIKKPNVEVGVVRRPWLDFEQSINDYRSQGQMFMDYNNITSSADYGVTISGQLGDDLSENKMKGIRSSPGRFGSFSLGIYNGGGYSALEENNNKLIEGRLSLRPLPDFLPGIQLSFNGAYGKGNIPESPDFRLAASAVSFESSVWVSFLQGFISEGDDAGNTVNSSFEAYHLKGWSFFNEFKPFSAPISLTLRYDELYNQDSDNLLNRKAMAGLAYIFPNRSKILLDLTRVWENEMFESNDFTYVRLVTEIRF